MTQKIKQHPEDYVQHHGNFLKVAIQKIYDDLTNF